MLDKNKNPQEQKTEEQKRADLALANLGMRPYNREDEPVDDVGVTIVDKVTSHDLDSEKALGSIVVDSEMVIPVEVSQEMKAIIGDKPLDDYRETRPEDSMKKFEIKPEDRLAS